MTIDTSTEAVNALVKRAQNEEQGFDASTGWIVDLWEAGAALAAERDALKADFNDCNAERGRWRGDAERLKGEIACWRAECRKLREAGQMALAAFDELNRMQDRFSVRNYSRPVPEGSAITDLESARAALKGD